MEEVKQQRTGRKKSSTPKALITLKLPENLKAELEVYASKRGLTIASVIRMMIFDFLNLNKGN